jgi:uncharacterized protein YjbI with pentapeptide repeats
VLSQTNITEEEQKIIDENMARLKQGVEVWNNWREKNYEIAVDLRNISLQRASLKGVNLSKANLSGADFFKVDFGGANLDSANLSRANLHDADLSDTNLLNVNLSGAYLFNVDLSNAFFFIGANLNGINFQRANLSRFYFEKANLIGANLRDANFSGAYLIDADFSKACLIGTDFSDADLNRANFSSANLSGANLIDSCIAGVKWNPRKMRGNYLGIRGIDASYGNALFKRAAADQDYLDTLENQWRAHKWLTYLFKLWGWIDYGRSIERVVAIAFGTMILFGLTYSVFPGLLGLDCLPGAQGCSRHSWFTPFYFSIVTFTTLGFGDITPKNLAGELIVSLEVILGYAVLGLLISVLADKVVRRS